MTALADQIVPTPRPAQSPGQRAAHRGSAHAALRSPRRAADLPGPRARLRPGALLHQGVAERDHHQDLGRLFLHTTLVALFLIGGVIGAIGYIALGFAVLVPCALMLVLASHRPLLADLGALAEGHA